MRILGIDYGEARVGIAITDQLNITVQGLETIQRNGSDKVILRRLDEIFEKYEVDTIVVGMPLNMNGTMSERAKITEQFVHKLKCKYNKMEIHTIDERLTTVEAHKTMNFLEVNKNKKKNIMKMQRAQRKYIAFGTCLLLCLWVVSFFAKISLSSINVEVEKLGKEVTKQEKTNQSLSMKINELASLENIQAVANNEGLAYNNGNIVIINNQ